MDKDVQGKLERLCAMYLQAQADLVLHSPAVFQTGRAASRSINEATQIIDNLHIARNAPANGLVRLAYVRAMREVSTADARMGEEEEQEAQFLVNRIDQLLGTVERQALTGFQNHVRRLKLVKWAKDQGWSPQAIGTLTATDHMYPLEQHARASALSVLSLASTAGSLAASPNTTATM